MSEKVRVDGLVTETLFTVKEIDVVEGVIVVLAKTICVPPPETPIVTSCPVLNSHPVGACRSQMIIS
jgi:hypothetical protein